MMQPNMSKPPRPNLPTLSWVKELFSTIAFIVAVYTLLQLALPRSVIQGRSMQPNFVEGQRLVISRVNYLFGEPQRGDIIVFNAPNTSPNTPPLIKRVIGLPGEEVALRDQQVYINGELLDEPYVDEPCLPARCRDTEDDPWVLGPDEYFMMGDNRNNSRDSRRFGAVPRKILLAKHFCVSGRCRVSALSNNTTFPLNDWIRDHTMKNTDFYCPHCSIGRWHPIKTTYVQMYHGKVISAPDIDAYVCDMCGYQEIEQTALRHVHSLISTKESTLYR